MKICKRLPNNKFTKEVEKRLRELEPATIGHDLHFGFMNPEIKSMLEDVKVVGTAFTVKTNVNDSTLVHKAVSLAEEGDVIIIDRAGDLKHACVGEMVAYAAKKRKVAGIIIDGPCTDIQAIREIGIPVFATGLSPITTKIYGEAGEINTTIQCGGTNVSPGDAVIADDNGVLVMGQDLDYMKILENAEESENEEPHMKKELDNGKVLSSLTGVDALIKEKSEE